MEEKSFEKEKFTREDGVMRVGTKVRFNQEKCIDRIESTLLEREFTVSEVIRNTFGFLSYDGKLRPVAMIRLEEIPEKTFGHGLFSIVPTKYDVYKWKKHYILSISMEQARIVWDTYIDKLKIEAGDGKPKLFKLANHLENLQDPELFPRKIGITCEYIFPCVLRNLEWDDDSVLFEYKG